ncbi:putative quercetin 2,3-dioxygenase [Psychrobacter glaciei]|uniref:Quercetin 2,3-dioxygenase n=1 Tax=Psychrobacter glaciei TaxID=619771 RepID=A0ABQ3GP27_9GAMM|nr:pirin-like C-terminal cupin domain-containing protein [Psychrobacter glaciei]GHD26679.1 putative quercetin 2,3-dioxygenase [Psychrobacter glaciei]
MSIQTLEPRLADVGGIPIARLLPNKGKKPIGAWCFLDHAGPADFDQDDAGMQVGRHPHTNLQTFSWMLNGEVLHKDSLGNAQVITKNQVNVMTAGTGLNQGISHTEQSVFPDTGGSKDAARGISMVQLWIALPTDQKIERSFHHYPELPTWSEGNAEMVLTTGSYTNVLGEMFEAPTIQYSKLVGIDVYFKQDGEATLSLESGFEYGILVSEGQIESEGKVCQQDQLFRFHDSDVANSKSIKLAAKKGTRIMFIGGEPLNNPVLLWWNFVADNKAEIEQSIIDWNNGHERFGNVDSDMKRLPAPELPKGFKG